MVPSCSLIVPRFLSTVPLELRAQGSQHWQSGLGSWRSSRCTERPMAWEAATYAAVISDCWATRESDTLDLLYLQQQEQLWLFKRHPAMCSTKILGINGLIKLQNPTVAPSQSGRPTVQSRKWRHYKKCPKQSNSPVTPARVVTSWH